VCVYIYIQRERERERERGRDRYIEKLTGGSLQRDHVQTASQRADQFSDGSAHKLKTRRVDKYTAVLGLHPTRGRRTSPSGAN